jgi:hypothetical protein
MELLSLKIARPASQVKIKPDLGAMMPARAFGSG